MCTKNLCKTVYSNFTYDNPKLDTIHTPIIGQMNKQNIVYSYNEYILITQQS